MGTCETVPGAWFHLRLLRLCALGLVLGCLAGCRPGRTPPPRSPSPPVSSVPRPEPPWLPVHSERLARLSGILVYGVCFDGSPPRRLVSVPPDLPPGHPLRRTGGVLIAHCQIDREGWVVQAQLLKGPDTPTVRAALVRAFAQWRFEPARLRPRGRHGAQPAAVHFFVTLPVEQESAR